METVILNLENVQLTEEQFYRLCPDNPERQLERTKEGKLPLTPPVGGVSGNREADFILALGLWNRRTGLRIVFSSSTVFHLPGGGDRSPDVAWIRLDRWESLTREEREKFPPICPDFVIELRSRTDSLPALREKMREYLDSGLRSGWLINPQQQQVEIYRPSRPVEIVPLPAILDGEEILPGFRLSIEPFE